MKNRSILITISGNDGVGKTTLANRLLNDLLIQGFSVSQLEFPVSEFWQLLKLLKKTGYFFEEYGTNQEKIGFLLNMERLRYILNVVKRQFELYEIVIVQRYLLDFMAIGRTQGVYDKEIGLLKDFECLININTKMYYIDIPEQEAINRLMKRGLSDDIREEKEFHSKLMFNYKELLKENVFDIKVLNGLMNPEQLSQIVQNDIIRFLNNDYDI